MMRILGVCLVLVLALNGAAAAQQPAQPVPQSELSALRQSLDEIVGLLRALVEQANRRDSASLMLSRIEMAERRLQPIEADLRQLRERRVAEEAERAKLDEVFGSIAQMEKMDRTGGSAAAFEAERQRVRASTTEQEGKIAQLDQQIVNLETELSTRRRAIELMDAQLDRLLSGG